MLVRFEDSEGRETWLNPLHVKVVRTRKGMLGGGKGTEVWFSFHATSEAIYFSQEPEEIAAALNSGMPPVVALDTSGDDIAPTNPQTGA